MAVKRKKSYKKLVKTRRKRPVKPPYKSRQGARRRVDPATGREVSRYAFEKKYGRKAKVYKKSSKEKFSHKIKLYRLIRDDYIEEVSRRSKGKKKLSKRDAMKSEKLKKIIRDLHSKNPLRKARALAETGRIRKDQIERFAEGGSAALDGPDQGNDEGGDE